MFKVDIKELKINMIKDDLNRLKSYRDKYEKKEHVYKNLNELIRIELGLINGNGELIYTDHSLYSQFDKTIKKMFEKVLFEGNNTLKNSVRNRDIYTKSFFEPNVTRGQLKFDSFNFSDFIWENADRDNYIHFLNAQDEMKDSDYKLLIKSHYSEELNEKYIDKLIENEITTFESIKALINKRTDIKENMINFIYKKNKVDLSIFEKINTKSSSFNQEQIQKNLKENNLKMLNSIISYIEKVQLNDK